MIKENYIKRKLFVNWITLLQDTICYEFEKLEKDFGKKTKKVAKKFAKRNWKKSIFKKEGGGISKSLNNGILFDKVGVNISEVSGKFDKNLKMQVMGAKKNPNYWAAGISVVAHMKNPKIPAIHFNVRYINTTKNWFGGGIDLTPSIIDKKESKKFHKTLKNMCDKHNKKYYNKYKNWCDSYFFLKHRNEPRGIGGIFFDYKKENWDKDFFFVMDVGICFINLFNKIVREKMFKKWNNNQKNLQLIKRGKYVEFNLLYDRGTKFGISTGGNIESIFMSLPPMVKWN